MDPIAGSSATNTITFKGNGSIIRFEPTVNNERAVIKLRGADHIIIDSLVIDASGPNATYGFGVQLFNDADSNVVKNCTILANNSSTSTNYAGVVISNSETSATTTGLTRCDGNLIDNNTITGGYYGITLTGNTAEPVTNNTLSRNRITDFYSYGIYLNTVGATLDVSGVKTLESLLRIFLRYWSPKLLVVLSPTPPISPLRVSYSRLLSSKLLRTLFRASRIKLPISLTLLLVTVRPSLPRSLSSRC